MTRAWCIGFHHSLSIIAPNLCSSYQAVTSPVILFLTNGTTQEQDNSSRYTCNIYIITLSHTRTVHTLRHCPWQTLREICPQYNYNKEETLYLMVVIDWWPCRSIVFRLEFPIRIRHENHEINEISQMRKRMQAWLAASDTAWPWQTTVIQTLMHTHICPWQ